MMQSEEPAGADPGPPASPAEPAGGTEAVVAPDPLIDAPGPILWVGFAVVVALVFLGLFAITRSRIPARRMRAPAPSGADIFQPAGDAAEITFDESDAPAPAPTRPASLFRRKNKEATRLPPDPNPVAVEAIEDAEVVIERPYAELAEPAAPASPPRRAGLFNIFSRQKRVETAPATIAEPEAVEAEIIFAEPAPQRAEERIPAGRRSAAPAFAFPTDAEPAAAEWVAEEDSRGRRQHEEALRREAAEDDYRRDLERRARAREAEFERNKLAAAAQSLEARERALAERERAGRDEDGGPGAQALRDDLAREFEARLAAHAERIEQRIERAGRVAAPPQDVNAFADLDAKISRLAERFETRSPAFEDAVAPGERLGAVGETLARRIADHQGAVDASIEALSREIVSLKRALGERIAAGPTAPLVQLGDIVRNALPPDAFEMRALLANNRKADCLVRLAHPPGPIAIDAQFPIEAFSRLGARPDGAEADARSENEFRRVALRHIVDVAERLIVPGATAESALLFLPSETMYTELHARFPDIVQDSFRARVWIVSPTTLMATLHTMRAVLRDLGARDARAPGDGWRVGEEVDALRRRVGALEENFGERARREPEPNAALRRLEPASERGARSQGAIAVPTAAPISASASDTATVDPASDNRGDLYEDAGREDAQRNPFPLR